MSHEDRSAWTRGPLGDYGPPSHIVHLPHSTRPLAPAPTVTATVTATVDSPTDAEIAELATARIAAAGGDMARVAQQAKEAALASLAAGTVLTPAERATLEAQPMTTEARAAAVDRRAARTAQGPASPLERARAQEYTQAHQRTVQQAQDAGDDAAYAALRSASWLTWEERQRIEQRHQAQLAARQTRGTTGRAG